MLNKKHYDRFIPIRQAKENLYEMSYSAEKRT